MSLAAPRIQHVPQHVRFGRGGELCYTLCFHFVQKQTQHSPEHLCRNDQLNLWISRPRTSIQSRTVYGSRVLNNATCSTECQDGALGCLCSGAKWLPSAPCWQISIYIASVFLKCPNSLSISKMSVNTLYSETCDPYLNQMQEPGSRRKVSDSAYKNPSGRRVSSQRGSLSISYAKARYPARRKAFVTACMPFPHGHIRTEPDAIPHADATSGDCHWSNCGVTPQLKTN